MCPSCSPLGGSGKAISDAELWKFATPEAQDNYRVLSGFCDKLLAAVSIEVCFLGIFRTGNLSLPHVFLDAMAWTVLLAIVSRSNDPFLARASELLFREQMPTLPEAFFLAEAEIVSRLATTGGMGSLEN